MYVKIRYIFSIWLTIKIYFIRICIWSNNKFYANVEASKWMHHRIGDSNVGKKFNVILLKVNSMARQICVLFAICATFFIDRNWTMQFGDLDIYLTKTPQTGKFAIENFFWSSIWWFEIYDVLEFIIEYYENPLEIELIAYRLIVTLAAFCFGLSNFNYCESFVHFKRYNYNWTLNIIDYLNLLRAHAEKKEKESRLFLWMCVVFFGMISKQQKIPKILLCNTHILDCECIQTKQTKNPHFSSLLFCLSVYIRHVSD